MQSFLNPFFISFFLTLNIAARTQQGYVVNDLTADFPVGKILNATPLSASFQQLRDRLTVVDFFGTWCVPCLNALPKLSALQEKYNERIRILLVSVEDEAKLKSFISKREKFILPVVVDEQEQFTSRFQPPSYPYTVVVGKNGKVLAIPQQDEITEENIEKWIAMQNETIIPGLGIAKKDTIFITEIKPYINNKIEQSANKLVQLSQEFIYAAKTGEDASGYIKLFGQLSMQELIATIKTDEEKKAFWINLYNAFTQVALKNNPGQFESRGKFFGSKKIEIAGKKLSLDDIEHGILRRSKIKWSLGHLNKLFPNKTQKQLRVDKLDYRLHFALNCGAKSCPPIAFYKSENVNPQLELATNAYLKSEVEYDEGINTVKLPKLMSWFRRDFGGKRKMIELLKQFSIIPKEKYPKIKFKDYDWTLYLQNYKS